MENEFVKIEIKEIKFNSFEYKNELELRDRVLRKPLGMNLFDENLTKENNDFHFGAFENYILVGVLILTKLSAVEVKMRQVAVLESRQNKTIGQKLVQFSEVFAKNAGYSKIVLNARKTAVGFYEKQGYEKVGNEFLEINIPHFKMQKILKSIF